MIGTKCFKRDRQFYCRIAICADKLIVFKLNDIALLLSDDRCHTHELARTIRKQYRYGKDPVSLNQSMLYDGCHRDDIHIATGENRNDLLSFYIQMLERRHGQQAGILYNHLMILNHIEEGYDQLIVTHGNDLINILLDVWEDVCSRCLYRSTIGNRVDGRKRCHLTALQGCLHTSCALRLHTNHTDFRIQQLCKGGNAGRQSASSDRYEDVIDKRKLLYDLHRDRSLSGRHCRIIKRMNKCIAMLLGQLICVLTRLVIYVAMQYNFRAVALRAVHFHQRRRFRHDDDSLASICLCRISYALRMVTGRSGDQSLCALLLRQGARLEISTADLIGTCYLHIFRLEIYFIAGLCTEVITVNQFCLPCDTLYTLCCFFKCI